MKRFTLTLLLAMLPVLPASAQSFLGFTSTDANLRAGPDSGYPRVTTIPYGSRVVVHGCIRDWTWCDTDWNGERGWVSGAYLETDYERRRVAVIDYGPRIGWPILTFALNAYWLDHYRHHHWYRDRDRWHDYRPPYRPPIRPPQHRPPQYRPPVRPITYKQPVSRPPSHQRPSNVRPVQQRPSNVRPAQQRPSNVRPAQQRPSNARPAQQRPSNARPAQRRPTTTRPAAARPARRQPEKR